MLPIDDKRDYFGFKDYSGGFFVFDSVLVNGKKINNIVAEINENNNSISVTTEYEDDNTKNISANYQFTDNDNVLTLTDFQKSWNNNIYMGDDNNG